MKVGLVLGAGGVVGASWLIGALEALASETGWDPARADHIVGTSAGSVIGALCAAQVSAEEMGARVAGRALAEVEEIEDRAQEMAERSLAAEYRPALALPPLGPGSWRLAVATLRHPLQHPPGALLSGWLPRGFIRTDPIRQLVERFVPEGWPEHPNYWAVACDYSTGARVAFGRDDAPAAQLGEAVAASCAIPAFYQPVSIAGRRYVDGGVCSLSNLDLLCGYGLDLVICLNPTSSLAQMPARTPAERVAAAMRAASGRRLGHEARKLREQGTEVLVIQPSAEDLKIMGANLMSRQRRTEVIAQSVISTAGDLRSRRGSGHLLPEKSARSRRQARSGGAPEPTIAEPVAKRRVKSPAAKPSAAA